MNNEVHYISIASFLKQYEMQLINYEYTTTCVDISGSHLGVFFIEMRDKHYNKLSYEFHGIGNYKDVLERLEEVLNPKENMNNELINNLYNKLDAQEDMIKSLQENYNRAIRILEKTELLPCELFEEEFDCTKCDYCNTYCSNADDNCWKHFIESEKLEVEDE